MNRDEIKLRKFARFADDLAGLSTCKRKSVGCVVMPADFSQVLSIGYNGPPEGLPNDSCEGADAVGACGCVHAEMNAVIKLHTRTPCMMFTTVSPCLLCAGAIINKRVIRLVLYDREYRDRGGILRLGEAGIRCESLLQFTDETCRGVAGENFTTPG